MMNYEMRECGIKEQSFITVMRGETEDGITGLLLQ